ncbi:MAG: DNA mismatch repair protein MutS [Tindallia sp. MSAO_Bac2]|nr:MAG: DNA mismatch repair protein MutS [Tindallia sp. MSAO_Bac2]
MSYFMNPDTPEQIGLKEFLNNVPVETEYGRILKENLEPVTKDNEQDLEEMYLEIRGITEESKRHPGLLKEIRKLIHGQKNIRKSIRNALMDEVLSDVELFEIKKQAFATQRLWQYLQQHKAIYFSSIFLYPVQWLTELLDPEKTGIETFYLYDEYDPDLRDIRSRKTDLQERILTEEKKREKQAAEKLNIKPLWNREIHIPKDQPEKQEELKELKTYVLSNETRSHWIYRPIKQDQEEELNDLLQKEEVLEQQVRHWLSGEIGKKGEELLENTYALARLDLLLGKVAVAMKYKCCMPEITKEPLIEITEGRHPGLEEKLKKEGLSYMPVDLKAKRGVTLITGANMGGKTMSLKMTALLTSMAQMGFWVPAKKFSFYPMDYIYFSTGDQQSQELGLSTFGAEVFGLKKALEVADKKGLILLDELASGTNPKEGYGISKAIVDHLSQRSAISIVTTHYDGTGELPEVRHLQVVGLKEGKLEGLEDELKKTRNPAGIFEKYMDYRLVPKESGEPVPRDAIRVAELMGLPEKILMDARKYLMEKD